MVTIKRIKALTCPTCKAEISGERRDQRHTNGYWNEYRAFTCGCALRFSPNFMKVEVANVCPSHPKEKEKREKRKVAAIKLEKYINRLDVDDSWKASALQAYLPA